MTRLRTVIIMLLALCLLGPAGWQATAQTTTGQISGSVVDSSGNVIVGAKVTLRNEGTGDARQTTSNNSGDFIFPTLVPGTYAIRVENPGFSAAQQTGVVLTANERRSLGSLELKVGSVTESVSRPVAASRTSAVTR